MARFSFDRPPLDSLTYYDTPAFERRAHDRSRRSYRGWYPEYQHDGFSSLDTPRYPSPWQQYYYFGHGSWAEPARPRRAWCGPFDGSTDPPPPPPRRGGIIPPGCDGHSDTYAVPHWPSSSAGSYGAYDDGPDAAPEVGSSSVDLCEAPFDASFSRGRCLKPRRRVVPLVSRTCNGMLRGSGLGRHCRRLRDWARHRAVPKARRYQHAREKEQTHYACPAWIDEPWIDPRCSGRPEPPGCPRPMAVSTTLLDEHVFGMDSYATLADVPISPYSRCSETLGTEHVWSLQQVLNGCRQRANASIQPVFDRRSTYRAGPGGAVSPHDELRLPFCSHWPLMWDSDSSAIHDRHGSRNKSARDALFAEDVKLEGPRYSKSRPLPSHPVTRSFVSSPGVSSPRARAPPRTATRFGPAGRRRGAEYAVLRHFCRRLLRRCQKLQRREARLRRQLRRARMEQPLDHSTFTPTSGPGHARTVSSTASSPSSPSRSSRSSLASGRLRGFSDASAASGAPCANSTATHGGDWCNGSPDFSATPSVPMAKKVAPEPSVGVDTHQRRLEKYNAAWTKLTTERSSSACLSHPIRDLPSTATTSSIVPWPTPSLSTTELTATSLPLAMRRSLARNATGHPVVGDCHAAVIKYTVYQFLVSPFGFRPVALRDDGIFGTDGPVTISLVVDDLPVARHKERNDDGLGGYFAAESDRYNDYVEAQHDHPSPRCTHPFQRHHRRCHGSFTPGLGSHPRTRSQHPNERGRRPKKAPDFQALKAQVKCDLKRWHPDRLLPLLSSMASASNTRFKSPASSPSRVRLRPSGVYQCPRPSSTFPSQECHGRSFDQPRRDDDDDDDYDGPFSCECDRPLRDSTSCQCPLLGPAHSSSCCSPPLQSAQRPQPDPACTTISEAEKDLVKDVTQAILDLFVDVRRLEPLFSS